MGREEWRRAAAWMSAERTEFRSVLDDDLPRSDILGELQPPNCGGPHVTPLSHAATLANQRSDVSNLKIR